MTEASKVPRPGAIPPPQNPLLSASVTGIALDDFPNKPLLLPAAPPIVHTPPPIITPTLLLGREEKSLVTVGSALTNDEGLDEINLNAPNDDNLAGTDENVNNFQVGSDSILSQAASSFSALPSVASNVFATFSKRITGSTSREITPTNDTKTTQPAQQLDIQPSYIQQQNPYLDVDVSDSSYTHYPQNNSDITNDNRNVNNALPFEQPKFYNPSEIGTFSVPPPPSSISSGQNNFRFTAKKKVYAPIPGLTESNQQLKPCQQPLTDKNLLTETTPFAVSTSYSPEFTLNTSISQGAERKSNNGIFSNITNLVPSGVLQNISGLVHSATQSVKPDLDTHSQAQIDIITAPTKQVIEPCINNNVPSISPVNYFESSVSPPTSLLNPTEHIEQQKGASTACTSGRVPLQIESQNYSNVTPASREEQPITSFNVNYFNSESQVIPDRPARPPSRKSLIQPPLESEPSNTSQFTCATLNTTNSQQSTLLGSPVNTIALVKPPTDSQLESSAAGSHSSFRLQKGTRLYKNPFIVEETAPTSGNLIIEPIKTPSLNVISTFTTSQEAAQSIPLHSPPKVFSETIIGNQKENSGTASHSESTHRYSFSPTKDAISEAKPQSLLQPINNPLQEVDIHSVSDNKNDKRTASLLTVTQPPLATQLPSDDTPTTNPYRRSSNVSGSAKSSQFILANFFTPSNDDSNNCNFFTNLSTESVNTSTNIKPPPLTNNNQKNLQEIESKSNDIGKFFCDSSTDTSNKTLSIDLNVLPDINTDTNAANINEYKSEQISLESNIPPPIGFENSETITNTINVDNQNNEKFNLNVIDLNCLNSSKQSENLNLTNEQKINNTSINQELQLYPCKVPSNVESKIQPNFFSSLSQIKQNIQEQPFEPFQIRRACSDIEHLNKDEEISEEMSGYWLGDKMATTSNASNIVYKPAVKHWFYKRTVGTKVIWTPFSHYDSALIETSILSGDETIVAVEGGRYDINISERKKISVYWESEPIEVRRCSWFYKAVDSKYIPYEESIADLLESEYKQASETGNWHKTVILGSGEQVVFHGPTVIVHFQQQQNTDAWGGTTQGNSRPRVVKRDLDDFHIEQGESQRVDHLLFMVHGIGSACDLKLRSVEEVVEEFRSIGGQLVQSHYKNSFDVSLVGRVEVLPISWHSDLHSSEMDEKLKSITLESIPKLRNFTNDTLLDILFYTSPIYCQRIMNTVANAMNATYTKYRQRNPDFSGGVSLAGHSLGSLILFDLLCHQDPIKESEEKNTEDSNNGLESSEYTAGNRLPTLGPRQISYTMGKAGTGQPYIHYEQLLFQPKKFFALGSPIGMFVTIRGIDKLGLDFRLPTCTGFYNIFHPYDPVAYRIEALINPDLSGIRPVLIPHHKGRKRMHLELKETMARVSTDLKQKFFDKFKSTLETMDIFGLTSKSRREAEELMEKEVEKVIEMQKHLEEHCGEKSAGEQSNGAEIKVSRIRTDSVSTAMSDDMVELDFPLGKLNDSKRVDYVLQEAPLEFFNEYIFALTSHVCYWDSEDTILFVMKEIYAGLGITPDSQVPQQTMTIERSNSRNSTPSLPSVATPVANASPT